MCFMSAPKIPDPKPAPPPPSAVGPDKATVEAANTARERALAGATSGRASTMLTNLTDADVAGSAQKKTLLGQG